MADLLIQLIPTAIIGALSPLPVLVVISLLMTERGLAKATAFAATLTGAFVVIGAVLLLVTDTDAATSDSGRNVAGTVVAAVGVVLIVLALRQLFDVPGSDDAPPQFLERLEQLSVRRAAALGVAVAVVNIKQLGIFAAGMSQIVAAGLDTGQAFIALVVFVLLLQSLVIVPVIAAAVVPDRSAHLLQSFQRWLVRHKRALGIVLGLLIGAAFVVRGVGMIGG